MDKLSRGRSVRYWQTLLLHLPLMQSLFSMHWTQVVASLQNGCAGFLQSELTAQEEQRPCWLHTGAVSGQSVLARHCTHSADLTLHSGAFCVHCALLVQPERQRSSWRSQIGVVPPQLAFDVHWTHSPLGVQIGELTPQSVLVMHETHMRVVVLQSGRCDGQSLLVLHWTHAPDGMSQIGAFCGQSVLALQAAWH